MTGKLTKSRLKFSGFITIFAAIILFYVQFSKLSIKDKTDFVFMTGKFQHYDFVDGSRGSHDYTFLLNDFSNSFQISADFLDFFDKIAFEELDKNEELSFAIAKADLSHLNKDKSRLVVFSLSNNETIFLDCNQAIAKYNTPLSYYAAGFFLLVGLGLLYFAFRLVV